MTGAQVIIADTRELDRLNRNLKAYIPIYKLSEDEILNKKGDDLRIQLFKGFFARRWKKAQKSDSDAILSKLTKRGGGILVRLMQLVEPWAGKIPSEDKRGRPLTLWQKLVAQEILRRKSGVGVLGVSFLRKRWRENAGARWLSENSTRGLGKAATFEKREHEFVISGFTPGLARVARKYGILGEALSRVSVDIERYLTRKLGPEFVKTLHGIA